MGQQERETHSPFEVLRRFSRPTRRAQGCELCATPLAAGHHHLLEVAAGRILCVCDPCAWRFPGAAQARFKIIPSEVRRLAEFNLTDAHWESLSLPINLAFFVLRSVDGTVRALYPSPAGATEALLPRGAWEGLTADNPVLATLEADVEALLINRVQSRRDYFLVPIDRCYELVGLIRLHWRGLSGGDAVWKEIDGFFERLGGSASRPHVPENANANPSPHA